MVEPYCSQSSKAFFWSFTRRVPWVVLTSLCFPQCSAVNDTLYKPSLSKTLDLPSSEGASTLYRYAVLFVLSQENTENNNGHSSIICMSTRLVFFCDDGWSGISAECWTKTQELVPKSFLGQNHKVKEMSPSSLHHRTMTVPMMLSYYHRTVPGQTIPTRESSHLTNILRTVVLKLASIRRSNSLPFPHLTATGRV